MVVRVLSSSDCSGGWYDHDKYGSLPIKPSKQGLQNLLDRIERMRALGPEFIDITWSVLGGLLLVWLLALTSILLQECWRTYFRPDVGDGEDLSGPDWNRDLYAFNMHQHARRKSGHCSRGMFSIHSVASARAELMFSLYRTRNSMGAGTYSRYAVILHRARTSGRLSTADSCTVSIS